jgi:membrane protein DedA with SNARE-associated domain
MAVVGSVIGGYLTYRIGRKGGKEALEQRLSKRKLDRVNRAFEKFGFGTVFLPALMPPPVPLSPFLLGAGALNYPLKKYLVALTLARAIRFTAVAYLASVFGRRVFAFFAEHSTIVLVVFISALVVAAIALTIYLVRRKRGKASQA